MNYPALRLGKAYRIEVDNRKIVSQNTTTDDQLCSSVLSAQLQKLFR